MSGLISRGKRFDITALDVEKINLNFEQLFGDLQKAVNAINRRAPLAASVHNDGTQSIPDATFTVLTFNGNDFDPDGLHEGASSRLNILAGGAGYWWFGANVTWAQNATGVRMIVLARNGVLHRGLSLELGSASIFVPSNLSTIVDAADGDYYEILAYQNSGGALACGFTSSTNYAMSRFYGARLGVAD